MNYISRQNGKLLIFYFEQVLLHLHFISFVDVCIYNEQIQHHKLRLTHTTTASISITSGDRSLRQKRFWIKCSIEILRQAFKVKTL